ncbi:hypothetical protein [Citrobacter youngae]|nr:hypothetical protein [Citrobacter youngae]
MVFHITKLNLTIRYCLDLADYEARLVAISRLGKTNESYLAANILRQIIFAEINNFKELHDSAFIVWCMRIKRGVTNEKSCGAAGARF